MSKHRRGTFQLKSKVWTLYPYAETSAAIAARISGSSSMTATISSGFDINSPKAAPRHAVLQRDVDVATDWPYDDEGSGPGIHLRHARLIAATFRWCLVIICQSFVVVRQAIRNTIDCRLPSYGRGRCYGRF